MSCFFYQRFLWARRLHSTSLSSLFHFTNWFGFVMLVLPWIRGRKVLTCQPNHPRKMFENTLIIMMSLEHIRFMDIHKPLSVSLVSCSPCEVTMSDEYWFTLMLKGVRLYFCFTLVRLHEFVFRGKHDKEQRYCRKCENINTSVLVKFWEQNSFSQGKSNPNRWSWRLFVT